MSGLVLNIEIECWILFCALAVAIAVIGFCMAFAYERCYAYLENQREHYGPYWAKMAKEGLVRRGMFVSYLIGIPGCLGICQYGNWFYPGLINDGGVFCVCLLAIVFIGWLNLIGYGIGCFYFRRGNPERRPGNFI
ncbi:MAG: hypothetical protein K2W82_17240 [Candidatus Obscuribacterales bacterium]|jgi:hypothetical protein|nr:hypothetical protein [Candidatus Obscuribacterales bacterium]